MKRRTAIISATAMLALCVPAFSGCGGGVKFTLSEEGGKHYIVSCSPFSSLSGEYEIPAYYGEGENRAPVTEIADEGFASSWFTKITVPETVTKIGTAAFSYCKSLQTVEFAEGIGLEKFTHGMFGESEALREIKIPDSVKTIEAVVFSGCTKLSSVTMNGVEAIGVRAFYGCTALASVSLPSVLKTIGNMAFYNSGIKEIEIPESVRDTTDGEATVYGLGYAAFNNCLALESVKICGGVKTIPSGAFGYCTALKEIYIPQSLEEVQGAYYENGVFRYGHAFYGNTALTDVYYGGSEEQWGNIVIDVKTAFEGNISMNNNAILNAVIHFKPDA